MWRQHRYAMRVPIHFLKRLSPRRSRLASQWFLRPFGALIHDPALWRLDRHGAARAFAVGLFFAWVPVPFQMALAAGAALIMRVHLPVAVLAVWLSNPVTNLPFYYVAYRLGLLLLGMDPVGFHIELSFTWLADELHRIWQPLLLGSLLMGVITATLGYFLLDVLWHRALVKKYHRIQAAGRRRASRELLNR